jgi:hypothetical protein
MRYGGQVRTRVMIWLKPRVSMTEGKKFLKPLAELRSAQPTLHLQMEVLHETKEPDARVRNGLTKTGPD